MNNVVKLNLDELKEFLRHIVVTINIFKKKERFL